MTLFCATLIRVARVAWLGAFFCFIASLGGCRSKPATPSVEIRVDGAQELAASLTQAWMKALPLHRERVAVDKGVHLQVWQDRLEDTPVLYLGVAWPQGWLLEPRQLPLSSPVKLGLALDDPEPDAAQYPRAVARLLELFWVQVELAQSAWPVSDRYLYDPYPVAVHSMTADWLGRHGQPNAALAAGCLALLKRALQKPRRPELERLENSVACLAKVATQEQVPAILDLMPNGHLRVEMARVELLGALGGDLAIRQLRWVQEQAQEQALVRAAQVALERCSSPT